jgi:hypothetical protein
VNYRLGRDLQLISDSATWAAYRKAHPSARVGFVHQGDILLLTLTHSFGRYRGIEKYASDARELLEVAHLALCEEKGIEVQ